MKKYYEIMSSCLLAILLAGCSSGGDDSITPTPDVPEATKIPISLNCGINTRVTDTGYDANDKIGLYVVNYDGSTAGTLLQSGNHVDNMCFTYNGTWTPASTIYWLDDTTPADFYCYYPYTTSAQVEAHSFSVKEDQSTTEAYKASEFLYGKAAKIAPTESAVNISTKHLLSCALVKVAAGNGFTTESLAASTINVKLNNVLTGASINLKDGTITATGSAASIQTLTTEDGYKALVVPQSVSATNLITVNVDGRDFDLEKEFTFVSGKRHTFTVTVSKTSNGINVGVTGWEDDSIDNGGVAE